ncbi:MAG: DUF4157 domain-containing protein [Proteobacteria bacterium]|nr:DUF4157 domain-containing protein [Pseudomonadota bacterium]
MGKIMLGRRDDVILGVLSELRSELSSQEATFGSASDYVVLCQTFDRLVLGYREGRLDASSVQLGIEEIREHLRASARQTLRPAHRESLRERTLNRQHAALAERFLSQPRGTWDSRHVEIVQHAIASLAKSGDTDGSARMARDFQSRMSAGVWTNALEIAESVSEIAAQRETLQSSIESWLASHEASQSLHPASLTDADRTLAQDERQSIISAALSAADVAALRAKVQRPGLEHHKLMLSRDMLEQAEQDMQRRQMALRQLKTENAARERIDATVSAVHQASQSLLKQEYDRLAQIQRQAIAAFVGEQGTGSDADQQRAQIVDALGRVGRNTDNESTGDLSAKIDAIKSALSHAKTSSQHKTVLSALDEAAQRVQMLDALVNFSADTPQAGGVGLGNDQILLEARLMYDQQRMRFEQHLWQGQQAASLLKALDYQVASPEFDTVSPRTRPTSQDSLLHGHADKSLHEAQAALTRVRQLAQSTLAGDMGVYAPFAGSEHAVTTPGALRIASAATPMPTAIPTLQSSGAKRSNRVLRDIPQLAFMPSVRSEMGFYTPRFKMDDLSQQPLFKRVKFDRHNEEAADMLPALYRAAGLKMKQDDKPLRKSRRDINLQSVNLEIMSIIENQFDPSMTSRATDKIAGAALDSAQRITPLNNSHARVAAVASDWIEAKHDISRGAADTRSLAKTGRMNSEQMAAALRSEGQSLPQSVQDKLQPFLGFDLSTIKIYTGSVAEMASEAMGAQAFTLGKSVFFGEKKLDFHSPEGLGLLAHELLHTAHFGAGDSVDTKEQAAEALEARVRNAFGATDTKLALEGSTDKKQSGEIDQRSSLTGMLPANSVGARPAISATMIFDEVAEMVLDMMQEDMLRYKQSCGDD